MLGYDNFPLYNEILMLVILDKLIITKRLLQLQCSIWNSLFTGTLVHKLTNRNLTWFKQLTVQTNSKRENKLRCVSKYHLPFNMVECKFSIKASSGSYDRIQLHGSIWWSAYFLKKKMVGVSLEYNWMFQFCGVLIKPVGVTIEYNCKVQYGGVLIFYKSLQW